MRPYNFLIAWSIIALCACTNNEFGDDEQNVLDSSLRIHTEIVTRSVIETTSFADGDTIGLFVSNPAYDNVRAEYDGTNWSFERIELGETPTPIYAYYPYRNRAVGTNLISVNLTPTALVDGPIDYMYGQSTYDVNIDSPDAHITFKHALARITLSIKRDANDNGDGFLSHVCLRNTNRNTVISYAGMLDLTTGIISDRENGVIALDTDCYIPTETSQEIDLTVIPVSIESEDMAEFELTIDNRPYIIKVPVANWEAGKQYVYPITINRN